MNEAEIAVETAMQMAESRGGHGNHVRPFGKTPERGNGHQARDSEMSRAFQKPRLLT